MIDDGTQIVIFDEAIIKALSQEASLVGSTP